MDQMAVWPQNIGSQSYFAKDLHMVIESQPVVGQML
jgi:hypothetical protein